MPLKPRIISGQEAAEYLGYSGPTDAFKKFCREIGVKPIRRGRYDIQQIDAALDSLLGHDKRDDEWHKRLNRL
ncbi:MAG: hypothetical protein CMN56_05310 [Sneathiella sp.]|nr:hypothetical protein [Sneathiella sp.]